MGSDIGQFISDPQKVVLHGLQQASALINAVKSRLTVFKFLESNSLFKVLGFNADKVPIVLLKKFLLFLETDNFGKWMMFNKGLLHQSLDLHC